MLWEFFFRIDALSFLFQHQSVPVGRRVRGEEHQKLDTCALPRAPAADFDAAMYSARMSHIIVVFVYDNFPAHSAHFLCRRKFLFIFDYFFLILLLLPVFCVVMFLSEETAHSVKIFPVSFFLYHVVQLYSTEEEHFVRLCVHKFNFLCVFKFSLFFTITLYSYSVPVVHNVFYKKTAYIYCEKFVSAFLFL
jgi:hypothetical protein